MGLKERFFQLRKERIKTYHVIDYDLSVARTNHEVFIAGSRIYVLELTGTVAIRFNEIDSDSIDLIRFRTVEIPFYRFFITNSAQSGRLLKLAVGVESEHFNISDYGVTVTQKLIEESLTPTIFNINCAAANTEYSQALGEIRKFLIKARGGQLRVSFTVGTSGTTFILLQDNQAYNEDLIHPLSLTLYFQSPSAGTIAEIVRWL